MHKETSRVQRKMVGSICQNHPRVTPQWRVGLSHERRDGTGVAGRTAGMPEASYKTVQLRIRSRCLNLTIGTSRREPPFVVALGNICIPCPSAPLKPFVQGSVWLFYFDIASLGSLTMGQRLNWPCTRSSTSTAQRDFGIGCHLERSLQATWGLSFHWPVVVCSASSQPLIDGRHALVTTSLVHGQLYM